MKYILAFSVFAALIFSISLLSKTAVKRDQAMVVTSRVVAGVSDPQIEQNIRADAEKACKDAPGERRKVEVRVESRKDANGRVNTTTSIQCR